MMAEEKLNEEKVTELVARAKELILEDKTVQVATVVMLNAWRLYYCSRAVLDNYVEEAEGLDTVEEKEVIKNIIANSMNSTALQPYKVEDLVAVLTGICVPFLQTQEENISEELDEEGSEEDDS